MNPHLEPSAGPMAQQSGVTHRATEAEYQAQAIAESFGAAVLMSCAGKSYGAFAPAGFKHYRDEYLAASGQPTDPIEKMLLEQILWAHFRLGQLHGQAIEPGTAETAALYNAAAVRLMAECRKHALALREYRAPTTPKLVTVVKQQNVAGGDQQIAMVDGAHIGSCRQSDGISDTQLTSKGAKGHADVFPTANEAPQSKASSGRAPELVETRPLDRRGSRTAAAVCDRE